jgi:hypothetical protein
MKKQIKRMRNFSYSSFVLLGFSALVSAADYSQTNGPATEYVVQLKKIELCTDLSCTTSHTLVEKTMALDIASVSVGAQVGSYAKEIFLPPRNVTFTHLRSTVDGTFTITGYAPSTLGGSSYCYTTSGSDGSKTALAGGSLTNSAATAAASANSVSLELPSDGGVNVAFYINGGTVNGNWTYNAGQTMVGNDFLHTVALSSPYVYSGKIPVIDMAFGTQLAVQGTEMGGGDASNDCNLSPGEPVITVTIN